MTRSDIETAVRSVIAGSLGAPAASDPAPSRVSLAAWDSLKHMEIVFAVEESLNVRFADADLPNLTSLDTIVSRVEALRAA